MGNNNKKATYTNFISFRCSPKIQLFLEAMAAQSELSRSTLLNNLIMEEVARRGITIQPKEVKHDEP